MPEGSALFGPPRPWWRPFLRLLLVLLALAAIVLGGWLGDVLSERQGMAALRQEANHRLDLFAAVVEGRIRRLEHVPATVQLSTDVLALLRQPAQARRVADANGYLRRLNAHLGSLAVFVLDERGTTLTTVALAQQILAWERQGEDVAFIIGGPDGLDPEFKAQAQHRIRLSDMTLPHAMARVLLIEQLYRAWSINAQHPYHRA